MFDIITMGSATIDCFVDTGNKLFQNPIYKDGVQVVRVPFGSKILIENLNFLTGGGGTNTAVSFSRLGLKTAYIGKFGGLEAKHIIDELKKEKVNTSFIVKGDDVGFSVVLDADGEDRTILAHKGCNNMLTRKEVSLDKIKTKWFYFASMVGESYKTQKMLMKHAKKNNIKVAFNPSSYIAKKGHKKLKDVLYYTDVLILNREEAGQLLGKIQNMDIMLKKLKKLVKGIVVVTDGKNGCYCLADKYYHITTTFKNPKETTGAGDSFASGFVAGIFKEKDIEFCLRMGQANAESVISKIGAKNDLLTFNKIQKIIKKKPAKIVTKIIDL
jgi:ribokinase